MICVTLSAPYPSLNHGHGTSGHWASRARVKRSLQRVWAAEIVAQMFGARPAQPYARARVTIWRHSVGMLDEDNAIGGAKPLLDVLKPLGEPNGRGKAPNPFGLGIITDDSRKHLDLVVHQVRVARRTDQKTVLRIEPIFDVEPASTAPALVGEMA